MSCRTVRTLLSAIDFVRATGRGRLLPDLDELAKAFGLPPPFALPFYSRPHGNQVLSPGKPR